MADINTRLDEAVTLLETDRALFHNIIHGAVDDTFTLEDGTVIKSVAGTLQDIASNPVTYAPGGTDGQVLGRVNGTVTWVDSFEATGHFGPHHGTVGTYSASFGTGNNTSGNRSYSFGAFITNNQNDCVAIGNSISSVSDDTLAVGNISNAVRIKRNGDIVITGEYKVVNADGTTSTISGGGTGGGTTYTAGAGITISPNDVIDVSDLIKNELTTLANVSNDTRTRLEAVETKSEANRLAVQALQEVGLTSEQLQGILTDIDNLQTAQTALQNGQATLGNSKADKSALAQLRTDLETADTNLSNRIDSITSDGGNPLSALSFNAETRVLTATLDDGQTKTVTLTLPDNGGITYEQGQTAMTDGAIKTITLEASSQRFEVDNKDNTDSIPNVKTIALALDPIPEGQTGDIEVTVSPYFSSYQGSSPRLFAQIVGQGARMNVEIGTYQVLRFPVPSGGNYQLRFSLEDGAGGDDVIVEVPSVKYYAKGRWSQTLRDVVDHQLEPYKVQVQQDINEAKNGVADNRTNLETHITEQEQFNQTVQDSIGTLTASEADLLRKTENNADRIDSFIASQTQGTRHSATTVAFTSDHALEDIHRIALLGFQVTLKGGTRTATLPNYLTTHTGQGVRGGFITLQTGTGTGADAQVQGGLIVYDRTLGEALGATQLKVDYRLFTSGGTSTPRTTDTLVLNANEDLATFVLDFDIAIIVRREDGTIRVELDTDNVNPSNLAVANGHIELRTYTEVTQTVTEPDRVLTLGEGVADRAVASSFGWRDSRTQTEIVRVGGEGVVNNWEFRLWEGVDGTIDSFAGIEWYVGGTASGGGTGGGYERTLLAEGSITTANGGVVPYVAGQSQGSYDRYEVEWLAGSSTSAELKLFRRIDGEQLRTAGLPSSTNYDGLFLGTGSSGAGTFDARLTFYGTFDATGRFVIYSLVEGRGGLWAGTQTIQERQAYRDAPIDTPFNNFKLYGINYGSGGGGGTTTDLPRILDVTSQVTGDTDLAKQLLITSEQVQTYQQVRIIWKSSSSGKLQESDFVLGGTSNLDLDHQNGGTQAILNATTTEGTQRLDAFGITHAWLLP